MQAVKRQSAKFRRGQRREALCGLRRRGAATLDYVLVMGAVLPIVALSYYYSTKIIQAVYRMTCALVCWPFMKRSSEYNRFREEEFKHAYLVLSAPPAGSGPS